MTSRSYSPYAQENTLHPSEQQRLDEAHDLYKDGKPEKAAPLFARIAEILTTNKQALLAANLNALAAQAYAESGNESAALEQARSALKLFIQLKLEKRIQYFYNSILKELNTRGMTQAAERLIKEFAAKVAPPAPAASSIAARLPSNCPQCGAPVHVNEAHGLDVHSLECAFCGTPIRPSA